ncbi:MAG: ATP-dependent zinc metalloprotease FtsH [Chloroflexota bacterium]
MRRDDKRPRFGNNIVYYVLMALILMAAFGVFPRATSEEPQPRSIPLSELALAVKRGEVTKLLVKAEEVTADMVDGTKAISYKEVDNPLTQTLRNYGVTDAELSSVTLTIEQPVDVGWIGSLIWFLPVALLLAMYFFGRRGPLGGGVGQAFNFAKSRARQANIDRPEVKFGDVAGVEEAKQELAEVVDFLKEPDRFTSLGAHIPKGLLLVGPPGTGKTLLARAVAGEAGVPFFSISGSEFVEMFVGVGAARVRDLFEQAKKNAPCIIFIDEIDAVGRQRGSGLGGGHDEREQTLNQILTEMDGFEKNQNVVVMAATNRPDVLDPALLRPGRFDRRVTLDLPDVNGRLAILNIHARGKPLESDVDLEKIAKLTPGFSGADLENLMNEGALLAARRRKTHIGVAELEEAVDRVIMGPQRKGRKMSQREKLITAYHEAGHALVAHLLPDADPVHKISIVARGMTGGHTRLLPTEDRFLWSAPQLYDTLAYALGGRAAERLVFGEITTGAGNDLEQATKRARQMVSRFGMSDKIGPAVFGHDEYQVFLGRELTQMREYSDETANLIDVEVRRLIEEAERRAQAILSENRAKLDELAAALMEKETLRTEELVEILGPKQAKEAPVAATKLSPTATDTADPQ